LAKPNILFFSRPIASVPLPRGYLYGIIFLTLFLAPNLAFIFPGLLGTYVAYLVLSLVSIASLGLVGHRGLGAIGVGVLRAQLYF